MEASYCLGNDFDVCRMFDQYLYKCPEVFNCEKLLCKHLKKDHFIRNNDEFKCMSCFQRFHNIICFKKHMLRHLRHKDISTDTQKSQVIESTSLAMDNDSLDDTEVSEVFEHEDCSMEKEPQSMSELLTTIESSILKFILKLHDKNNFSRKDVSFVQENVGNLIVAPLVESFSLLLEKKTEDGAREDFLFFKAGILNLFKNFETEYKMVQYLERQGLVEKPCEFTINHETKEVLKRGTLCIDDCKTTGIIMPIQFQIKSIFKKGNLLQTYLEKIQSNHDVENYSSFFQGSLWRKKKEIYNGDFIIPYFLYSDSVEIDNALGSHSGENATTFFYYCFPDLFGCESSGKHVFPAALVKTKDLKSDIYEIVLKKLINFLIELEKGFEIETESGQKFYVKFILALIIGDNLAVNSITGFSSSFNANFYCRLCKSSKTECSSYQKSESLTMRTIENYQSDLKLDDEKKTGIYRESLFNGIPNFHVSENLYFDIMHDVFEGVCHYDLCHILHYFIKKKFFDLNTLNNRKSLFDYGPQEAGNQSVCIKMTHILKKKFKMSASEMQCFVTYLPTMLFDLVPHEDEVWKFLLLLNEIVELLLSFNFPKSSLETLRRKIETHNHIFVTLFSDTLKPKFHNLLHYPSIIASIGPLRKHWCYKFEKKHREFKLYARSTTSRKNICISLARKFQLKFVSTLMEPNLMNSNFECLKCHEIENDPSHDLVQGILDNNDFKIFKECTIFGHVYKKNSYVATHPFLTDIYVIKCIIKARDTVSLFCQKILRFKYIEGVNAVEIDTKSLGTLHILDFSNLVGPAIHAIPLSNNKHLLKILNIF